MLEEPLLPPDPHEPRARSVVTPRPLRAAVLTCALAFFLVACASMGFATLFSSGVYETQARVLAEAAAAIPEVRARWEALHLKTFVVERSARFAELAAGALGAGQEDPAEDDFAGAYSLPPRRASPSSRPGKRHPSHV